MSLCVCVCVCVYLCIHMHVCMVGLPSDMYVQELYDALSYEFIELYEALSYEFIASKRQAG